MNKIADDFLVLRDCSTLGGLVQKRQVKYGKRRLLPCFRSSNHSPPSDGLVGIQHKLVNHWCALEDWANKKEESTGPVLTLRAPRMAGHTPRRGEFNFF
jgi:hypothetical protein